jgi:DNA helicase-2/ATP-dependent DNA helicase PcrA
LSISNSNLNPAQKEAVLSTEGPLLVLAGAGTGKTKVLTERIVYIINSYLANPNQILAVTFTNKAAGEMKNRISATIGDAVNNIWMGTFHGIATRILKRHADIVGLKPDFTIIDSDDQLRLLKQITTELNIDSKQYPPKAFQYQIERIKDKGLLPEDLNSDNILVNRIPRMLAVYTNYQNRLQNLNAADFGDLLLYNLKIFEKSPENLAYYQDRFRYILVDEYQDTNSSQYQWLLKLTNKYKNICCVGDDDQSIYSWRGAEIANILRFSEDYPNTKIIRLEENYRSTGHILKAASHLIKNNDQRHDKTLWTGAGEGNKIKLLSFINEKSEASNITHLIQNLQRSQLVKLNNVAILVRAGYQTRSLEEAFIQSSLPYRIIGGLRFYERMEIKDAIAYLRIVSNFSDDLALERIINLPKRGVGNASINKFFELAKNENCSLLTAIKRSIEDGETRIKIGGKIGEALKELTNNLEKWHNNIRHTSVANLAKEILADSGYIQMWENQKTPDAETRFENLQEFINSLEEFDSLEAFLEHVSLVSGDEKLNLKNDMVSIMTIHSAKGLEFENVFIPGLEEGVFPSGRSIEERDGLEEERRLFYVAITRAKKNLFLSFAQSRVVFGSWQNSTMSRFLKELPEASLEIEDSFLAGFINRSSVQTIPTLPTRTSFVTTKQQPSLTNKRMFHQKFGYGKVIEINGDKVTVAFEKAGIKTVMKDFLQEV